MRLIVTGGGTGGHVYPALEVARLAGEHGFELLYLGSLRGQEGRLCEAAGILFQGFPSEPLWSLKTPRGWRALSRLYKSIGMARRHMKAAKPDVVFSTGGYSAAPVLAAASSLKIPFVILDGNSVPGRTNRMFGRGAASFLSVFRSTATFYKDRDVVRVGQPIRRQLRAAAEDRAPTPHSEATVLVLGGSQGSAYLNESVPQAMKEMQFQGKVIHAAGPTNFAETQARVSGLGLANFQVEPYLETSALLAAYRQASVVVCRSGGTLAELALFRIPSVLVPLPSSADQHQLHNALEFEEMGAGVLAKQESSPFEAMTSGVRHWISDADARSKAQVALAEWDIPDATDRIVGHIKGAADKKR